MSTVKELWIEAQRNNKPLLLAENVIADFPFLADYATNFDEYDRSFSKTHGIFSLLDEMPTVEQDLSEFHLDVFALLWKNRKNLQQLYDLIEIKYDPLVNYDRKYESEEDHSGEDILVKNNGARKFNDIVGESEVTNQFGEVRKELINAQSAFNSEQGVWKDADKSSETTRPYKDTSHSSAVTNVHNEEAVEDREKQGYGSKLKLIEHTVGNIGVTSSQQLWKSEWDLWTTHNFYELIFNLITSELLYFHDAGWDVFKGGFCDAY